MNKKLFFIASIILSSTIIFYSCKKKKDESAVVQGTPTAVGTQVGTANSLSIGATGGTITSTDGRLELIIPANALSASTTISIQPFTNQTPGGAGVSYSLKPDGQQFNQPVTVRFHYDSIDIIGTDIHAFGIAYQKPDNIWYSFINTVLDEAAATMSISTSHFSVYSLYKNFRTTPLEETIDESSSIAVKVQKVEVGESVPTTGGDDDELVSLGTLQDYDQPSQVSWTLNGNLQGNQNDGTISPTTNSISTTYSSPASTSNMSSNPAAVTAEVSGVSLAGASKIYLTSNIKVKSNAYHCQLNYNATNLDFGYCIENSYTDHATFDLLIKANGDVEISNVDNFPPGTPVVSGNGNCSCSNSTNGDQLLFSEPLSSGYIQGDETLVLVLGYFYASPTFSYNCPGIGSGSIAPISNTLTNYFFGITVNGTSQTAEDTDITGPELTLTLTPF